MSAKVVKFEKIKLGDEVMLVEKSSPNCLSVVTGIVTNLHPEWQEVTLGDNYSTEISEEYDVVIVRLQKASEIE